MVSSSQTQEVGRLRCQDIRSGVSWCPDTLVPGYFLHYFDGSSFLSFFVGSSFFFGKNRWVPTFGRDFSSSFGFSLFLSLSLSLSFSVHTVWVLLSLINFTSKLWRIRQLNEIGSLISLWYIQISSLPLHMFFMKPLNPCTDTWNTGYRNTWFWSMGNPLYRTRPSRSRWHSTDPSSYDSFCHTKDTQVIHHGKLPGVTKSFDTPQ